MTVEDSSAIFGADLEHSNDGYNRFRGALRDGRLKAGMTLTQHEMAELLGMSLSPLRVTLVLLEDYGLVEIKPRSGIHIVYPGMPFIRENMQYRIMIEAFAMPIFIRSVTEEWQEDIRNRHKELQEELRIRSKLDANWALKSTLLDRRFHGGIVAALSNDAIRRTYERVIDNMRLARQVHQSSPGKADYFDSIDEHMLILDAVEAGDTASAIAALEAHFRASTHRVFIEP